MMIFMFYVAREITSIGSLNDPQFDSEPLPEHGAPSLGELFALASCVDKVKEL